MFFPYKINTISDAQCSSLSFQGVSEWSEELDSWEARLWNEPNTGERSGLCSELTDKTSPGEFYVAVFFIHPDCNEAVVCCELGLVSPSPHVLTFQCCCLCCCWATATMRLKKSVRCGPLHSQVLCSWQNTHIHSFL